MKTNWIFSLMIITLLSACGSGTSTSSPLDGVAE